MAKKITSIASNRVGNCSITLLLDKRTKKKSQEYPLSICFNIYENGKERRYYYHLHDFYSEKYFHDVCSTTASRSSLLPVKKEWEAILNSYRDKVVKLSQSHSVLTVTLIKSCLEGKTEETHGFSFLDVWRKVIESRRKEGRVATAQSYNCALNSFLLIIGEIPGFAIDKNIIMQWNEGMKNGVLHSGVLVGKIADATRGIYLRACRVIWHEAVRQGFLTNVEYPFSNKDNALVSIPRGRKRQQSYLNVDEWTELYRVFEEKRYPENWNPLYKDNVHQSLGLFLAQYLCNGFNLADAARLRYNDTYWKEGGKAFEFQRKKTAERSNDNSVVVVPIIEPLQNILNEIAAPPSKGGYVFPQIFHGTLDEGERRRLTLKENCNIKDRVRRVCKEVLGWEKELVSGTWARHSFATNLKLAGVDEEYIAESMGHSHGNDVTRGYQDMYPLEIKHRNNMNLLKLDATPEEELIERLSPEEIKKALQYYMRIVKKQRNN